MDADAGFFGPSSVTWRVHADPMMLVAGLRALYLQALHPVALRGVADHSDFRGDPWGRLSRTGDFIGSITYGTREQAQRASSRVQAVHGALGGIDPHTGRAYRVDEPDLLRWIHSCEVDSFVTTTRRAGLALSDEEADEYLREQRLSAELVDLDPETVPTSRAELDDYFAAMRPQLCANERARQAMWFVLVPPMPTWLQLVTPARPAWTGAASLAFALLPRWARRLYGMPGLPTTDVTATASAMAMRRALLALPAAVRDGPHLKQARRRLGSTDAPAA